MLISDWSSDVCSSDLASTVVPALKIAKLCAQLNGQLGTELSNGCYGDVLPGENRTEPEARIVRGHPCCIQILLARQQGQLRRAGLHRRGMVDQALMSLVSHRLQLSDRKSTRLNSSH